MKPLDMADKYPPAESFEEDDEPTIRMAVPYPQPYEEKRYPGVGLLIVLGSSLLFWGTVAYFIFR